MARPRFEDLPLSPDHPPFSAWGLWGKADELGTLVRVTKEENRQDVMNNVATESSIR